MRSRMEGGVGGGSTDDSEVAADVEASPFGCNPPRWSLGLCSTTPSEAVSDSMSKRTLRRLPRLLPAVAGGAGVATHPPGGAGVGADIVLFRDRVDGGVARPPSELDELASVRGAEPARSSGSLVDSLVGAGVANHAPGGRGVLSEVRSAGMSPFRVSGVRTSSSSDEGGPGRSGMPRGGGGVSNSVFGV